MIWSRKLIDLGANIEELHNKLSRIEPEYILIIKELFKNFTIKEKFTYSFLDLNFVDQNKIREFEGQTYSGAYHIFTDTYITKVKDRDFGFVVLPDLASKDGSKYRCSFRSLSTGVDTTVFTRKFGGGGHKAVSGCTVEASSVSEALDKVFKVIDENYEEALKT